MRDSSSTRDASLDLLRTIAILLVVAAHTNSYLGIWTAGRTSGIVALIHAVVQLGVPIFVMLTGYLMLDRDYTGKYLTTFITRNLLPLFVSLELWNLILWGLNKLYSNPSLITMLKVALFVGPTGSSFWFLPMIFAVYLGLPLLSQILKFITRPNSRIYAWILLATLLFFGLLIPTAKQVFAAAGVHVTLSSVIQMNIFGASVWGDSVWMVYLILGWVVHKAKNSVPPPYSFVDYTDSVSNNSGNSGSFQHPTRHNAVAICELVRVPQRVCTVRSCNTVQKFDQCATSCGS